MLYVPTLTRVGRKQKFELLQLWLYHFIETKQATNKTRIWQYFHRLLRV